MSDALASFDMDACGAPASDGGITPSMIPIPKVDPDELEAAASSLRTAGENLEETAGDIKSSWGSLSPVYVAPESEALLAALDPVTVDASDVATASEKAASALETFAETARELKRTLLDLKAEAEEFREEVGWDDEWLDDKDHRSTSNRLNDSVARAVYDYQVAERECANAIGQHYEGTSFSPVVSPDALGADATTSSTGRELARYGPSTIEEGQDNPWGSSVDAPTNDVQDALAGASTFVVDLVAGIGMTTGVWRDGRAAYPFGTEWGENMRANLTDARDTFFAVVGSDAQSEWQDPGSREAQWENSRAALAEIGDSIIPVSEFDDRPAYTVVNGTLNVASMISPSSWFRASGEFSGGPGSDMPGMEGNNGDWTTDQGTTPSSTGGNSPDTTSTPETPSTQPDVSTPMQGMNESLDRLNEQLGGGNQGSGPAPEAPAPPPAADPSGPSGSGDGSGGQPGSGEQTGPSSGPEGGRGDSPDTGTPTPTPGDSSPSDGGNGSSSTDPDSGQGRGDNDTGTRGDADSDSHGTDGPPPRENSDNGGREGASDRSGTDVDPTAQGLRDGTTERGTDRTGDPWTTSPNERGASPDAPALRDPGDDSSRTSPSDSSDHTPPATPREDAGSPAPSTEGGGSGSGDGTGRPPPPGGDADNPPGPGGESDPPRGPGEPEGRYDLDQRGERTGFPSSVDGRGNIEITDQATRNKLSEFKLNPKQVDSIMRNLSSADNQGGIQAAEIINSGRLDNAPGYLEMLTSIGSNHTAFATDKIAELRFANDLANSYPQHQVIFPEGTNNKKDDVDVQLLGENREQSYSYQIKNTASPNSAKNKIRDVIGQLQGSQAQGTNPVGIFESAGSYKDFPSKAINQINSIHERTGIPVRLYFEDGVITVPEGAQIYP